jgi:hypothetical protein
MLVLSITLTTIPAQGFPDNRFESCIFPDNPALVALTAANRGRERGKVVDEAIDVGLIVLD